CGRRGWPEQGRRRRPGSGGGVCSGRRRSGAGGGARAGRGASRRHEEARSRVDWSRGRTGKGLRGEGVLGGGNGVGGGVPRHWEALGGDERAWELPGVEMELAGCSVGWRRGELG